MAKTELRSTLDAVERSHRASALGSARRRIDAIERLAAEQRA